MKFKWEHIDKWNSRLKVPGGWVLQRLSSYTKYWLGFIPMIYASQSTIFIPDSEHKWVIENEESKLEG